MKIAAASVINGPGQLLAEPEQDQEDQRIAQEIIAESREELAPEQRRETARQKQRLAWYRLICDRLTRDRMA